MFPQMKRRKFVLALAAPAAPVLIAQQLAPVSPAQPVQPAARAAVELPKLETAAGDSVAQTMPRFFNAQQFSALQKLSDVLMPSVNGMPGALDAKAPEFLDFLIQESPADRQQIYRTGLDALNAHSKKQFGKDFAGLQGSESDVILACLRKPWTYETPSDPLDRFLRAAKQDVRTATVNSREYNASGAASGGGRRFGANGLYWLPLE
jgi:hypothetical protein